MSKLSNTPMYYELLETDPKALMVKLTKLSKSFELIRSYGGKTWVAKITKRIDGHKVTISEVSVDPAKALQDLDNAVERAGLYGKN